MDSFSHAHIGEMPLDALSARSAEVRAIGRVQASSYFLWKDAVGRCLAVVLTIVGLPIMLFAIVLVRLTSPGPAIYRQIRVGRRGQIYTIYKIRSMRWDAEKATGPVWSAQRDPRVTWVGRILRVTHIDEFPQLFNVIKGEMALIGPRPERPEFSQRLAAAIPGYMDRLLVRPGITGLAQINLPPDTDLESVRRKLALDLQYVAYGNAWLDVRIFLCTFARLLGINAFFVSRILGLTHLRPGDGRKTAYRSADPGESNPPIDRSCKASNDHVSLQTILDEVS